MPSTHRIIDFISCLANDGAALGAAVGVGPSSDSVGQIPSAPNRRVPQAEIHSKDGYKILSSMYEEKMLEFDSMLIKNWREDANNFMILSGLVSAAVSGFLAQSYISFQTNSQDVSAFYLSQIYELQAGSKSSASSQMPARPVPAPTPTVSHQLWFVSLMMSFGCAISASRIQARISRYQLLTRLRFDPRSDPRSDPPAYMPPRMPEDVLRSFIPSVLGSLKFYLHSSIFLFVIGLLILPHTVGDMKTFTVAISFSSLAMVYYLLPVARVVDYFSPFRGYGRKPTPAAVRGIEEHASTWTLNARSVTWLLNSLTKEEEIERFLMGISFYKLTQVEDPAKVLEKANKDRSPKAILAFTDRSLSSDLPEETGRRRIKVALEAMQTHPYVLQRCFYHSLRACSTESAIFKSVDFVLLADQYANDKDVKICSLARSIIAIAINRFEDYHADMRWAAWAGIIQRRLNWPEDLFHWEHRDSIKLRNLIQLTRELGTPRPDDEISPEVLGILLQETCKLNVRNAAPKLQNDFCNLWNELVAAAQLPDQDPALLSNLMAILSFIRAVHASLHQGTESQSPPSPLNTTNVDPPLPNHFPYSLCTVRHLPVTPMNPSPDIFVALNSGDA